MPARGAAQKLPRSPRYRSTGVMSTARREGDPRQERKPGGSGQTERSHEGSGWFGPRERVIVAKKPGNSGGQATVRAYAWAVALHTGEPRTLTSEKLTEEAKER